MTDSPAKILGEIVHAMGLPLADDFDQHLRAWDEWLSQPVRVSPMTENEVNEYFNRLSHGLFDAIESSGPEKEKVMQITDATLGIIQSVVIDIKRIANALNEPNDHGEVGSAALAGAITRGLRNR